MDSVIRVFLNIKISIDGVLTWKVCDAMSPVDIGPFYAPPNPGANSTAEILLVPNMQGTNLTLKPVAVNIVISTFDVQFLQGVVIGAQYGPIGALIGFIVSQLVDNLINSRLPQALNDSISSYMASMHGP